jgi:hypothetical protein
MPDGYRRGGAYHRGGRTYWRRGTRIKAPVTLLAVAGAAIALSVFTGSPLISSPVLVGAVVAVGIGYLVWRNRKRLARVGKRMDTWAQKKAKTHGRKPTLVARAPAYRVEPMPRRAAPDATARRSA